MSRFEELWDVTEKPGRLTENPATPRGEDDRVVSGPATSRGRGDRTDSIVDHPPHYTAHPSGVECIQITEHFGFLRGNAIKYLWRAGSKGDTLNEIQDLLKARWYIDRELSNLDES